MAMGWVDRLFFMSSVLLEHVNSYLSVAYFWLSLCFKAIVKGLRQRLYGLPSRKYLPSVLSQSKFAEHWVAIVCWTQSGLVVDGEIWAEVWVSRSPDLSLGGATSS